MLLLVFSSQFACKTNETGREKDNMGENFKTPLPPDVTLQSNKETMMTCIVEDQNHETHNIPNQDMDFGRSTLSFSSEERVTNFTLTKDSTLHSPSEEKKIFEKSKTLSHIESNDTNAPTKTLFFPASDVRKQMRPGEASKFHTVGISSYHLLQKLNYFLLFLVLMMNAFLGKVRIMLF